jgi:hypothetical protein
MKSIAHVKTMNELLRMAIDDLKKSSAAGLDIDMEVWVKNIVFEDDQRSFCCVCFAGSVLINECFEPSDGFDRSRRFILSPNQLWCESKIDIGTRDRLYALNDLRMFDICAAATSFYGGDDLSPELSETLINIGYDVREYNQKHFEHSRPYFDDSHGKFYGAMEHLYDVLFAAGL